MSKKFDKRDKKDDPKFDKKSKFNRRKGRGNGSKTWEKEAAGPGSNDVSWYTPDLQLLNDAGRWPYSRPVGTPLNRKPSIPSDLADNDYAIPGICAVALANVVGPCQTGSDAANVAAEAMYTFIRHANSGSRNYDANDLMLYTMQMDSIYSILSWITRLYATVGAYASMNKYLPDALAKAQMNVDLESIRSNMANFRANINSRILKIGALLVPDTMAVFRRHAWIYSNYYSEGDSIKDQIYFYYPTIIYRYKLDSDGAGMLEAHPIAEYLNTQGKLDANGIYNMLDDMITPIFNDEDFNIIGGDILKAYGESTFKLMLLPDLIIAQPIHNAEVLLQLKNLRTMPIPLSNLRDGMFNIVQDENKEFLIQKMPDVALYMRVNRSEGQWIGDVASTPDGQHAMMAYSKPYVLTTPSQDVTPAENMVNTRLTSIAELDMIEDVPAVTDIAYGTEIPLYVDYYTRAKADFSPTTHIVDNDTHTCSLMFFDASAPATIFAAMDMCIIANSFKYHPPIDFVWKNGDYYASSSLPFTQVDNYTTIDFSHLEVLHDVAILGEYNVPRLAVVK